MDPAIFKNIQPCMIIGLIRLTSYISLTFSGQLTDAIARDLGQWRITMTGGGCVLIMSLIDICQHTHLLTNTPVSHNRHTHTHTHTDRHTDTHTHSAVLCGDSSHVLSVLIILHQPLL